MRSYFLFHKHFYELDKHPEPSQISQMEPFAKIAISSKKTPFQVFNWILNMTLLNMNK